ncbi:hypothetical protein FJZ28_00540 [Candidatus Peregrinibacteria bacterium]|nr:hypothetical protein [Candidatus Peregrinibacteria bacterium]
MEHSSNDIAALQERNRRVEADKAWETSWTRRLFIATLTYASAVLFMHLNGFEKELLQALIPSGGYLLSTLTLPPLKQWWIGKRRT